ncbi:fungal-specific transcription factor domain-containing protein [Scheffersomyces amazonensis]|uniref:fungal-specific transcription factor domain-containing protein n=1 Tax=Scheffersomyces amazonensis TaxID=1078765 RepID=UPI00315CE516
MSKITRVRTGCWTCKRRHRKCDEAKPFCNNCLKSNRECEGYGIRLSFDVDDSRNKARKDKTGFSTTGFVGKPRAKAHVKTTGRQNSTVGHESIMNNNVTKQDVTAIGSAPLASVMSVNTPTTEFFNNSSNDNSTHISNQSHSHTALNDNNNNSNNNSNHSGTPIFNSPRFIGMRASSANLEQFSSELFEDLEMLLKSPGSSLDESSPASRMTNGSLNSSTNSQNTGTSTRNTPNGNQRNNNNNNSQSQMSINLRRATNMKENLSYNLGEEIIGFIDKANVLSEEQNTEKFLIKSEGGQTNGNNNQKDDISLYSMSHQEENMMLKHFFKKLLPLLDAHPNSPWPDLALKYCDFDIARSCFISLACIHMYECRKGGNEYYQRGVAHINNTMDHLIRFISTDNIQSTVADDKKKQIHSLVILVLINVHILFAVLEKGKSSLSRFFFKVFASICQDPNFYNLLITNEKQRSLVVVLSWYDTVSAIVSPDCRLPYCLPSWYGSFSDNISTSKMMGCPGEIFKAMSKVCYLRHEVYNGADNHSALMVSEYQTIKQQLINYRDYVLFEDGDEDYAIRLKCAQCWSLAVLVTLDRVVKPVNYEQNICKLVNEFISVYGSMEPVSPMTTQMVWPVYAMGCECKTAEERASLMTFMETLYRNAQMGTLFSLKEIVQQVWALQISQEEFLKQWLDTGVDYLPL